MKKILTLCMMLFAHAISAMDVIEFNTKKGIKVWFVEDKSSPIIAMQAVFKNSGSIHDSDQKLGLSGFASALMGQGTKTLDYKSWTRKMEELSIKGLGVSAGMDHINVSLQTLSRSKDESFSLLKEALMNPRFDEVQFKTLKEQTLAALQEADRNPSSVAVKEGQKMLFPGHPYGRRNLGTPESIQSITQEDLLAFTKTRFSKDRLIVGICGNLTQEEVGNLVDSVFSDLPSKSALPEIEKPKLELTGQTREISWDIPQTIVKFADYAVSPKDPDFHASNILFTLLGGGSFENRLMQEIRVKRGLTYGIGVFPLSMEMTDVLMGGFSANTAKVSEAIQVVKDIWKELKATGPTAEEVEKAKDFITNSYVHRFTETSQIAAYLVGTQLLEFPSDYFKKRNALVRAVTLEDVKRVGDKLLNPDKLSFVVVGEKKI